ncbi:EEF1A lysine methyltransferase 3-like [Rhincodon typus]|uniref:EEF1A lysine methyltransferase 3-like n=1 Tax=Rhincodon typus TaxID=259920 RepID=UPI00202E3E8B|nr:EEF1A lysine methyltransferase 3-like [Rhincodon typus]
MAAQQELNQHLSSYYNLDPSRLTSRYEFCGYELNITRDFSKNLGIPAVIWEPGRVLCRFFEKEQINFTGKKVIELGSGTGMVGILAILLGGDVTLTDQPIVLSQIQYNVSNNIPAASLHRSEVAALSWGKDNDQFPSDYDYILGSDIVYKSHEFHLLINTLLHLSNPNTIIYFSTKMRQEMGAITFHENLIPQHFNSEIVHRVSEKDINVYKMTKKCSVV